MDDTSYYYLLYVLNRIVNEGDDHSSKLAQPVIDEIQAHGITDLTKIFIRLNLLRVERDGNSAAKNLAANGLEVI